MLIDGNNIVLMNNQTKSRTCFSENFTCENHPSFLNNINTAITADTRPETSSNNKNKSTIDLPCQILNSKKLFVAQNDDKADNKIQFEQLSERDQKRNNQIIRIKRRNKSVLNLDNLNNLNFNDKSKKYYDFPLQINDPKLIQSLKESNNIQEEKKTNAQNTPKQDLAVNPEVLISDINCEISNEPVKFEKAKSFISIENNLSKNKYIIEDNATSSYQLALNQSNNISINKKENEEDSNNNNFIIHSIIEEEKSENTESEFSNRKIPLLLSTKQKSNKENGTTPSVKINNYNPNVIMSTSLEKNLDKLFFHKMQQEKLNQNKAENELQKHFIEMVKKQNETAVKKQKYVEIKKKNLIEKFNLYQSQEDSDNNQFIFDISSDSDNDNELHFNSDTYFSSNKTNNKEQSQLQISKEICFNVFSPKIKSVTKEISYQKNKEKENKNQIPILKFKNKVCKLNNKPKEEKLLKFCTSLYKTQNKPKFDINALQLSGRNSSFTKNQTITNTNSLIGKKNKSSVLKINSNFMEKTKKLFNDNKFDTEKFLIKSKTFRFIEKKMQKEYQGNKEETINLIKQLNYFRKNEKEEALELIEKSSYSHFALYITEENGFYVSLYYFYSIIVFFRFVLYR